MTALRFTKNARPKVIPDEVLAAIDALKTYYRTDLGLEIPHWYAQNILMWRWGKRLPLLPRYCYAG